MKRALIIIGRFAFGGWALVTGVILLVSLVSAFVSGSSGAGTDGWIFVGLFLYGFIGIAGGAAIGLVAAILDRLIKPSTGKSDSTSEAVSDDPAVWPPAPKPPEQPGS